MADRLELEARRSRVDEALQRQERRGLRAAKKMVAAMRAEMAADPAIRRSSDPFARGQRAALNELVRRIDERLATP